MIKKLRIKFVVINMTIVTIMISIMLSMVFYFTEVQMGNKNIRMMQEIANHYIDQVASRKYIDNIKTPYFAIRLGANGERIFAVSNYYDMDNETFLDEVVLTAMSSKNRTGEIEMYNLRYCFVDSPHSRYLLFSDISDEKETLNSLMKTCSILGVVSFFLFLGISIPLSGWAVKPVNDAIQQQKQFIGDASHELKTPLTVLITNAQLIQSSTCSMERKKKCMDGILIMAQQMKFLVEQLLELARIDTLDIKESFTDVDLSKLAEEAILPFEPVFFERNLSINADIQTDIHINGYTDQIRQLIEILLDNAQKYTLPNGKTWIRLKKQFRGRCILSVSNEGISISDEQIDQLFKRFYRADEARKRNGSFGLGLSIAEAITEQHHGRIWAESENGINSFYVEFPCL